MLRIKKEIDLKELEKFGFEFLKIDKDLSIYTYNAEDDYSRFSNLKTHSVIDINCKTRIITEYKIIVCDGKHSTTRDMICTDILFDLVQAGYVEKVEE